MENCLASENLAIVSYRLATDPTYIDRLPQEIAAGKIEGGGDISSEEAGAIQRLLDLRQNFSPEAQEDQPMPADIVILGTWIG